MKKTNKSRYFVNDPVMLTKNHKKYTAGHIFLISDPNKHGKLYEICVRDPETGRVVKVPSKYLVPIK